MIRNVAFPYVKTKDNNDGNLNAKILRVHGQKVAGHWLGPVTRLGRLGLAEHPQSSWAQLEKKILKKISFKKYVIFRKYFIAF